jgi:hypothetical protein
VPALLVAMEPSDEGLLLVGHRFDQEPTRIAPPDEADGHDETTPVPPYLHCHRWAAYPDAERTQSSDRRCRMKVEFDPTHRANEGG